VLVRQTEQSNPEVQRRLAHRASYSDRARVEMTGPSSPQIYCQVPIDCDT
jgi:hypothetical protein